MERGCLRRIITTTCALALCICVRAQLPDVDRPSLTANAMSVQRYADIPVSLYTGTPDITIPLDTLREFRMALPMTLSYHCGGVKVDEHPGWTGLGWTLALGGVITREVQDTMDDFDKDGTVKEQKRGFMYCHNHIMNEFNDAWVAGSSFTYNNLNGKEYNIGLDTEPDIYHFSFNGITGFFVMDTDGAWRVFSNLHIKVLGVGIRATQKPMDVELNYKMPVITTITLLDDNGIRYEFGGTDAMDMSIDIKNQGYSQWCPTAWYLKKMVHPDGKQINFSYERGPYTVNLKYGNFFSVIRYNGMVFYNVANSGGPCYTGQLLTPVYLKRVKGETFTIDLYNSESTELNYSDGDYNTLFTPPRIPPNKDPFLYLGGIANSNKKNLFKWHQLDSVIVTGKTGNRLKKISMAYSSNSLQRLTLNSVSVHGTDGKVGLRYAFGYTNMDKMPRYLSADKDAWGFYKNADNIDVNVPGRTFINPSTMLYGSLNEITWPTGGKTLFEFEPHTYSRQLPLCGWGAPESTGTFVAGGLRVKSITDAPADSSQPHTRRYLYVSGYKGDSSAAATSGILEGRALYFYANNDNAITFGTSSTSSLLPCSNSLGHIVCYPEAVELSPTGGWTIYKYTSLLDSNCQNEKPVNGSFNDDIMPDIKFTSNAHYRGLPTDITSYNADGGLAAITRFVYAPLQNKKIFAKSMEYRTEQYVGGGALVEFSKYSFYKVYTHRLVEIARTRYAFGTNALTAGASTSSSYSYNQMGQVSEYREQCNDGSKWNTLQRNTHYAWETDTVGFKKTNELNYVVSVQNQVNGNIVDSLTNTYGRGFDDGASKYHYLTERRYGTGDKSSLNLEYQCLLADSIGFPVFVKDAKDIPAVYLWHSDRLCPLAVIRNATYEEVKEKLGVAPVAVNEDYPNIQGKLRSLYTALPKAFITTYTYIPHIGITGVTDPSGKSETYEYDNMLRLCRIRDNKGNKVAEAAFSTATTEQ